MFRFRKNKPVRVVPRSVVDDVMQQHVDENGTVMVTYVKKQNSEIAKTLPAYSEYQLDKLLAANVPLHTVSSNILDTVPSDETIESVVSSLEKADVNSNEPIDEPLNDK